MQFEKIFINNENGKVNGYRQKGKWENGKIELSLNEKFGDDGSNKLAYKENKPRFNKNAFNNAQNINDAEFIKLCENKLNDNVNFNNKAIDLRVYLRLYLEKNLNVEVLNDFKILVDILDNQEKNESNKKIVEKLIQKYKYLM